MKVLLKALTLYAIIITVISLSVFSVLGASKTLEVKEHNLSLTVPESYILLNEGNASKNRELIENFGLTADSFKKHLERNNIIIFGLEKENHNQLILKCWETDFSKDINEFSSLNDDSLNLVIEKLVTVKGSSYRALTLNGMRLIEVRFEGEDQMGKFYSVQYVTIRNGKIYSLSNIFTGDKTEDKTTLAFSLAKGLSIKDTTSPSTWTAATVLELAVMWIGIVGAAVAITLIIISFIKDRIKFKEKAENGNDTISRRRR